MIAFRACLPIPDNANRNSSDRILSNFILRNLHVSQLPEALSESGENGYKYCFSTRSSFAVTPRHLSYTYNRCNAKQSNHFHNTAVIGRFQVKYFSSEFTDFVVFRAWSLIGLLANCFHHTRSTVLLIILLRTDHSKI